jgi:anti-sigma factor RsiW
MKHLLCASVNRVLEAYHDGELPVEEQIVVETHLTECYLCASEARSLRAPRCLAIRRRSSIIISSRRRMPAR